jgi:hypothetical protein
MVPIRTPSRRGFLFAGGGAVATLGAASAWLALDSREAVYAARLGGAVPQALTPAELAILMALVDVVITPVQGCPTGAETQTARRIDRELTFHMDTQLLRDVKSSLALLERLPLLDLAGHRFTALSRDAQTACLKRSETSSWTLRRRAFGGLKFLITFIHYSDDRTWPSIGYGGPMVQEKPFEGGNRIANLAPLSPRNRQGV